MRRATVKQDGDARRVQVWLIQLHVKVCIIYLMREAALWIMSLLAS